MQPKITVLIVDDHPVARAGIRAVEQADDMEVAGEAQDGDEAMRLVEQLRPNVLLLDLKMPGARAWEVEKWVRENYPEMIALVLTGHDRDFYLAHMLEAGAAGYLDKNERPERLLASIRAAARGEMLFTPEQLQRAVQWKQTAGRKWDSLTERERQVARLLVEGKSDLAIAEALEIGQRTASSHVSSLLKKLEVDSRQEAMAWLVKHIPEMSDDL